MKPSRRDKVMNPEYEAGLLETRRHFLQRASIGIGAVALASLEGNLAMAGASSPVAMPASGGLAPHFHPTAKRIIYLFMAGAPSQIDLWDYKPRLKEMFDKDLPDSVRM